MSFLDGLKSNLKFDEMSARVSGAVHGLQEKSAGVMESGVGKMAKENFSKLSEQASGVTSYINSTGLGKYLPSGGGKHQSPIDIVTSEAKYDETLGDGSFTFGYSGRDSLNLENTGHSLTINMKPDAQSSLTAAHYTGEQLLRRVDIKWGTEPMNGSEHLIGGVGYAGEIHLVHVNSKYGTYEDALKHPDGLAIIAVFLNESHDDNPALNSLLNKLGQLTYAGSSINLERGFDVRALLPDKMDFWTYDGSLTLPAFQECVRWTVYRASIPISSTQLDKLRQLYAVKQEDAETNPAKIAGNVRPAQPTNARAIRSSFRSGGVCE